MTGTGQSYRFGPVERRGLLGPIRGGQAILVSAALLAAVLIIDRLPNLAGASVGLLLIGGCATLTALPLAGRTADEWLPVAAIFAGRRLAGRGLTRSPLPMQGARWSNGRLLDPEPRLPPTLRGVSLVEIGADQRRIGVLSEHRGRRLTAVLACQTAGFALLDPAAQERRLSLWGNVLAGLAGTPTRRLQWLERTGPAQPDQLAHWLRDARDPSLPLRGAPIVDSYIELINAGTRVSHAHEVLIAVQIEAPRTRRRPLPDPGVSLVEQLERVARGLEAAEIRVLGALGAGPLARVIRTAFDPFSGPELHGVESTDRHRWAVALHQAAPHATRESWEGYQTDGARHSTYWISSWPQVDVSGMFLDPLLGSSRCVRTVAVTFEPVEPDRSTRDVEAAITRDRADSELRRRFGQSETARQRQVQDSARRREAELAAGHGEVRLSGFVTVSGRSDAELRLAAEELHQQATRSRLVLHRLYGQQAEGFTFTLPLARGLR